MPQTNKKITALYCRLSKEDLRLGESESIQNQKQILERYAKENHFPNIRFFVDDGVSGVEFKRREGLQEMLDEVDAGNVAAVIVKDLSRLGRDHLETDKLIELTFPQNGVRFIAISDGVDTIRGDNEFMTLRNWFNEFYARDTSKKIRAVKYDKARRGERVSGLTPYGYTTDPDDRNHLIPDPDTADVVRKIFKMYVDGSTLTAIQGWLREDKIYSPAEYRRSKKSGYVPNEHSCFWYINTIEELLRRVEYVGDTITNKSHRVSFKLHNQKPTDDNEQFYFTDTHEPLIDRDVFERAQMRLKNRIRHKKDSELDILSGLLFCGECGGKMHSIHATTGQRTNAYVCGNYRIGHLKRVVVKCSAHYIRQGVVLDVLLADIMRVLTYVKNFERQFISEQNKSGERDAEAALAQQKTELAAAEKRLAELDILFRKSYEDNALGKLSDEQFSFLTCGFDEEKRELERRIEELRRVVSVPAEKADNAKRFVSLVKKHKDFKAITYENVHELIERVLIHSTDLETKTRKIEIYYRYIGKFQADVPPISYEYRTQRFKDGIRVILS